MRFSEKLGAHLTPEWRQQYICYVDLKNMILNVTENAPLPQIVPSRAIDVYYGNFEEEFFFECEKELRKINTFYAEKLAEATRRSEALSTALDVIGEFRLKKQTQSRYSLHASAMKKTSKKGKKSKMEDMRNAYSELYLSLVLLQNYKVLNHTGFRKILKKHDKLLNNDKGAKWFAKNVDTAHFHRNADLDRLIAEAEYNVTEYLENGDRAQAMKRLRVPPLEETQEIGTVFRVGFFTGAFTVLLAAVFLTKFSQTLTTADEVYGLLLFRGPFYVIVYLFLLGINVLHWRQFGVNHILIFEINPRKRLTYSHLLELHGIFGVLWSTCVLGFIYAQQLHVSRYWFPLALVILMLIFLLMPFNVFHLSGRLWLMKLMLDVFCLFGDSILENGDRAQAMKRLRVPPLEETQEIGTVFRVGFFTGAFTVLLAAVFLTKFSQTLTTADEVYGLLLFRGPFYVIVYLFLLGINVLHWRQFGVNHILIFEINPRKRLTYSHLLELHGIFGVLWSTCVLGFIYAQQLHVSRYWFPLALVILLLIFLLMPFNVFHLSGRLWLMKLMGRVCAAPFYAVGFADFWFGDQLNSLVCCLLDFKYLLCFYIFNTKWRDDFEPSRCLDHDHLGNAIIRCLPAWFRFAQSLRRYRDTRSVHPFLVNAGKYFTTFPMVVFSTLMAVYRDDYPHFFDNPFVWCYIVSAIVQTLYCYSWDVLRDFSLFENFSGKHIFLRDQIIYPASFYYFTIVENLILRFFWAISLFMTVHIGVSSYIMDTIAGCLEIVRRYIWNYLRLENEHLFNVGQFRAVRDIFIAPIAEEKSSINLERMMDEDDGVRNRRQIKFYDEDDDKED